MFRKKFHGQGRQFLGKSLCWGNGLVPPLRSSGNLGPSQAVFIILLGRIRTCIQVRIFQQLR